MDNETQASPLLLILLSIAVISVIIYGLRDRYLRNSIAAAKEASDWLIATIVMKGQQLKFILGSAPHIILHKGEELLCVFPDTTMWSPRAVRISRGGYGGPSFRVAKGIWIRFGAYSGTSESHDELRALDQGTLSLTNKRLLFSGSIRNISIALSKIVQIKTYLNAIELHREGKEKAEHFEFSSNLKVTYQRNGKNRKIPVNGWMVRAAVEQARFLGDHPEYVGKPLDILQREEIAAD